MTDETGPSGVESPTPADADATVENDERAVSVVLVGPPGAGKSTIGRKLARELGVDLYDTDAGIEEQTGRTIPEIFAEHGEPEFRRIEEQVVRDAVRTHRGVISLGGGSVLSAATREVLRGHTVIYLEISVGEGLRRTGASTNRPLLAGDDPAKKYRELMKIRRPLYREVATIRVRTDGRSPGRVVRMILAKLGIEPTERPEDSTPSTSETPAASGKSRSRRRRRGRGRGDAQTRSDTNPTATETDSSNAAPAAVTVTTSTTDTPQRGSAARQDTDNAGGDPPKRKRRSRRSRRRRGGESASQAAVGNTDTQPVSTETTDGATSADTPRSPSTTAGVPVAAPDKSGSASRSAGRRGRSRRATRPTGPADPNSTAAERVSRNSPPRGVASDETAVAGAVTPQSDPNAERDSFGPDSTGTNSEHGGLAAGSSREDAGRGDANPGGGQRGSAGAGEESAANPSPGRSRRARARRARARRLRGEQGDEQRSAVPPAREESELH